MSADPFNFGPPNEFQPSPGGQPPSGGQQSSGGPLPPGGQQSPGGQGNPFFGSVPDNPLSGPSPAQSSQPAMFGGAPATQGDLVAAKPPTWLLFLAAGLALVAGVTALLLGNPIVAIVCWVVAGPVAIGLLALFVVKDTFARSSGLYAAPDWVKPMHYVAIGLCLLCILAPALRIADWVGHL